MTVDRTGDYSGGRWRGKVVNVMDPTKQGRMQVRVFGMHDNESLIPNSELPWALARVPINSGASTRGVSGSPVGVIPGTIVDGYFADSDRRTLVATGSLMSAGRTRSGQVVDGSYTLDSNYNDVANSARGQDLNAALGLRNLPALSQIGAIFPMVSAGLGSLPSHTGNILSLLSTADPYNMSGSMASSISGFSSSYVFNQLMSTATSFTGGIGSLAYALARSQDLLSQGVAESQALAALPTQIQVLAANGGISQLLLLANSMTNIDPTVVIGGTIGGLMSQALGLASAVAGGFNVVVNEAIESLAEVSKLRNFAMKAASPAPPPIPEAPTTTSSTASTKPSGSGKTDPYADITTVKLPPPITSIEEFEIPRVTIVDDLNLKIAAVESMPAEQTNPVYGPEENTNIMRQLIERTQGFTGIDTTTALTSG